MDGYKIKPYLVSKLESVILSSWLALRTVEAMKETFSEIYGTDKQEGFV